VDLILILYSLLIEKNMSELYSSKTVDHLGLVSGLCKDINLVSFIDELLPKQANNSHISFGQLFLAMILNGLGFTGRTLHMFPQYFKNKPTERLIGKGIKAEHINDDSLGRCLDELYNFGVSDLYQNIAEKVIAHLGLECSALNLDSTSMHVDGDYKTDGNETKAINITRGYSRDHRPELNQVILNLITENQAGIPVYMQACSGNTNDSEGFKRIVKSHVNSLKEAYNNRYLIGDAALYSLEIVQSLNEQNQLFITRVPQKIKQAQSILADIENISFNHIKDGYSGCWFESDYADVDQKWLLIKSEQAYKREIISLDRRLKKSSTLAMKAFEKLSKEIFNCKNDAEIAFNTWQKKHKFISVFNSEIITSVKHLKSGRPKKNSSGDVKYSISGNIGSSLQAREDARQKKGVFILATNDCSDELEMQNLLELYKSQQSVERGFRFLKSPDFLTSSIFLKKPERIESLLMIMTSCLMIYAALEHLIRKSLKEKELYFTSMKNKPCQKPTARWVFQCFIGIDELSIENNNKSLILNLCSEHEVILNCLGKSYWDFYS
jgi:transposase